MSGLVQSDNGDHHRVAAKVVSKIDRGRPATSVHGLVLAVFRARARAQSALADGARARSIKQLYHSILVNALIEQEFGNG
jgi:hypothetical protein